MTAILPTRISLYDFLVEDTQPIDSILADSGNISIMQARRIRVYGLQAIVSALLRYEQKHGADVFLKKILKRGHVRQLRNYNAFNFQTIAAAMQYGHATLDCIFAHQDVQKSVIDKLALLSNTPTSKVIKVLGPLGLIAIREIAILTDFSHLDANEIHCWFELQPQFLVLERNLQDEISFRNSTSEPADNYLTVLTNYNPVWHEMTGYQPPASYATQAQAPTDTPNYAKVIGRMQDTATLQNHQNTEQPVEPQNQTLYFAKTPHITLPHTRWLLQLAKISDIYLSRNRLKIAPEPEQPPQRPLLNFGIPTNAEDTPTTTSEVPFEYDKPTPLWKDKSVLLILSIVGGLFILAVLKYNYKQSNTESLPDLSTISTPTNEAQETRDIAIVRINEDDETASSNNANNDMQQNGADDLAHNSSEDKDSLLTSDTQSDLDALSTDSTLNIVEQTTINAASEHAAIDAKPTQSADELSSNSTQNTLAQSDNDGIDNPRNTDDTSNSDATQSEDEPAAPSQTTNGQDSSQITDEPIPTSQKSKADSTTEENKNFSDDISGGDNLNNSSQPSNVVEETELKSPNRPQE